MKFLHLSDLHIGKNVNGFSMLEEQRNAFDQIIGYAETERPDAVIIAGDVYDRTVPGIEAVRLFDDFLTELVDLNVIIMIISGNHDSPERLNYASRLLYDKNVFIYGAFDGTIHKITLKDEHGNVNFWLLPFIKPLSVRSFFDGKEAESYSDALAMILKGSDIDHSERNVLVSHQFFTMAGFTPERSESEINPIGGLDAMNAELIKKFDYVALGHLHGAQKVGVDHVRYAGSPVKYSFSEWRQKKSITLTELKKKGELIITPLSITPIHDMREIKGQLLDMLTDKDAVSQSNKNDYIRAILTDEDEVPDPAGKLRSVYPNIMSIDFENSRKNIDISKVTTEIEEISRLSPYDLFGEFFLGITGSAMSEEQSKIVMELMTTEEEE